MENRDSEEIPRPKPERSSMYLSSSAERAISELMGMTISGIKIRVRKRAEPACQLIFQFTDGSEQEFYAESEIKPAKGRREAGSYARTGDGEEVVKVGWKTGSDLT